MRIVHVADSFAPDVGGIESQVLALARAEQADGHDVTVITAVNKEPIDVGLEVHRGLRTRWLTVAFPWLNHRMVARVLDDRPVDVVHAHFTVISPIAIYATRAAGHRGIPVAATVHSVWWSWAFAARASSVVFVGPARMRAVWSGVSRMIADRVQRTLPKAGPVTVVPNLVDVSWWAPPAGDPVPAPHAPLRLTLVGRLKPRKQIDRFLDLLARVRDRAPDGARLQVDIVGEGPRRDQLQRQIERLGLSDWVRLVGNKTSAQVRDILWHSDLFVAPSRMEAFGIAALEARGAGLPVLAYADTGVADFIESGVEGILVRDDDELVQALLDLLADPERLAPLRAAVRSRPPSVSAAASMRATYALYDRAIATRGGRSTDPVHGAGRAARHTDR